MKRKKSFLAGLCTLILAVSLAFGGFAYTPAYAANTDFTLNNVKIQSEVSYGDAFAVPANTGFDVSVTTPNGTALTSQTDGGLVAQDSVYNVTADELGHYTVTFTESDMSYSFKVFSSLEEELQLFVRNEAQIPTYVKTGDEKKLPAAYIGYYDEDGKVVEVPGTVTVTTDTGVAVTPGENFKFENAGSTFIVYSAKVNDGKKYLSKSYEVKVQNDFTDTKAPTLSISGVPSSGNVNTAVTLPVATASDSFDSKVEVIVTVKGKDASGNLTDVKKVELDDNDYAVSELSDNEVFDNDKNMTFYPVRSGDYRVVYQAVDDNGNKSAEWTYTITVSDKKAPTLVIDETKIPEKWGYSGVIKLDGNDAAKENITLSGEDLKVKFQFPEAYDNADKAENLILSFSIKDPESRTVVNFTNINKAEGESGTRYTNTVTNKEYVFNNTMTDFAFDFGEYVNAIKSDSSKTDYVYEGDYVVTYSAEDASGNKSTKTFTVNIVETFEDTSVVTVEFNNVDKYVLASETEAVEFTVPTPAYSSTTDTKLNLVYDIYNADPASEDEANALGAELKGGEVVEIKYEARSASDATKVYKVVYDDKSLEITDSIVLVATATSDAGNTASATEVVPLVKPSDSAMFTSVDIANINLEEATKYDNVKTHKLGYAVVNRISAENRKYVGVELGVKTEDGDYLTDVSAEVYSPEGSEKMVIRNISFNTNVAGTYYLELRVFDLNGKSTINVIPVTIEKSEAGDGDFSASVNVSTADINTKIMLNNETISAPGIFDYLTVSDEGQYLKALVREISGGRFSIMGEEFTAMSNGFYSVKDKAVLVDVDNVHENYAIYTAGNQTALDNYLSQQTQTGEFTVSDSSTVSFELQGVMPTYSVINPADENDIRLPLATAFTSNGNADEIVLSIKSPSGSTVTPYYMSGDTKVNMASNGIMVPGTEYRFKPTANGTYTVTYTVKMSGKEESTFSYTIKAGDVIAPTFTLTDSNGNAASHELSVKSGYKFNFLYVKATDDKASEGNLTFTKKVVGPDGEVVGGTISGKGTTYANRTYPTSGEFTLDASGKYTVTYTVTDEAGNESKQEFEITVTNSSGGGGISLAALSTILIVVGVLLIVGVVIYLFRFRRVKKD